jgi:hypothetical protein
MASWTQREIVLHDVFSLKSYSAVLVCDIPQVFIRFDVTAEQALTQNTFSTNVYGYIVILQFSQHKTFLDPFFIDKLLFRSVSKYKIPTNHA